MPKNSGLSHLADVARRDGLQILHSYPIRKKREPRRLNPNLAGIEWLESDANNFDDDTEIEGSGPMEGTGLPADAKPEFLVDYAAGRERKSNPRPMFQIIPRDAFSGMAPSVQPCPGCYDFARAWTCPDHAERHYDPDHKVWRIVHTPDAPGCECNGCQPVGFSAPEAITETYRRIVAAEQPGLAGSFFTNAVLEQHREADLRDRLAQLEDDSITGTFTLEITGDTLQADGATIQIEVGRSEGTP